MSALRDISVLIGKSREEQIILETGDTVIPGLDLTENAAALFNCIQKLQQGLFNVLVLGEFKTGKSTLINALLGSSLLPSKAIPATAITTVIIYGEKEDIALYTYDQAYPRMISWDDFSSEFQFTSKDLEAVNNNQFVDRFQGVDYAQMECPQPLCANGVKLIDTPGLSDLISRTKVTATFLKQADAAILVLNAVQILRYSEREFIESFSKSINFNKVFFVVNKVDLIDEDEKDEIEEYTKDFLEYYFLNKKGEFEEEIYNRRVFFVNARSSLDGRIKKDNKLLEESGILPLEKELEQFLTSNQKVTAALESTVNFVAHVTTAARRQITQKKFALNQPLSELEDNRIQIVEKVRTLEKQKTDIERIILFYGEIVSLKIYASLMHWIDDMYQTWPEDSNRLIKLDELSFSSFLKSSFSESARKVIAKNISGEVNNYLEKKLLEWSKSIPALIQEDLNKMLIDVEDKIGLIFSSLATEDFIYVEQKKLITNKSLIPFVFRIGDYSLGFSTISGLLSRVDWSIIWSIIYMVTELLYVGFQQTNFKKKILESIRNKLFDNLRKVLFGQKDEILEDVQRQFTQFSQNLSNRLQAQIEEISIEQKTIVSQKQDRVFSVEKEKRRLDIIDNKLLELFNKVSVAVYGKSFTPEEIEQLVERNSL